MSARRESKKIILRNPTEQGFPLFGILLILQIELSDIHTFIWICLCKSLAPIAMFKPLSGLPLKFTVMICPSIIRRATRRHYSLCHRRYRDEQHCKSNSNQYISFVHCSSDFYVSYTNYAYRNDTSAVLPLL